MSITPTDISLVFLGILILLVLLEVRRLGRSTPNLEKKFEALSQRLGERLGPPPTEMKFRGGAQIVEAGASVDRLSEELERLDGSVRAMEPPDFSPEGMRRFLAALESLRDEIAVARELVGRAGGQYAQAAETLDSAGEALERVGAGLESAIDKAGVLREGGGG